MPATEKIKVAEIRALNKVQPRARMDQDTIDDYAELVKAGQELPPGVVFFDKKDGFYYLAEGFHRLAAHEKAGKKTMDCIVREGTVRDAQFFALTTNASHGLRRTNADKRRVVETMLKDEEWGKLSDRAIAKHCAVSHEMVRGVRTELSTVDKPRKDAKSSKPAAAQDAPPPDSGDGPPADGGSEAQAPTHCDHGRPFSEECKECEALLALAMSDPDAAPPPEPSAPGKDMRGREVPPELAGVFTDNNKALSGLEREVHDLKRRLAEFAATPAGAALRADQIGTDLGNVARAVRFARAYTTCPMHPNCSQGCNTCKGLGWIVKEVYDRLPAEVKA